MYVIYSNMGLAEFSATTLISSWIVDKHNSLPLRESASYYFKFREGIKRRAGDAARLESG